MASTIQLSVEDDLKNKADSLFRDLGTDTTNAIRMFLAKAVAENGFPFEVKKTVANPYVEMSEEEILLKLEKARKQADEGKYREANNMVADIRTKYGL